MKWGYEDGVLGVRLVFRQSIMHTRSISDPDIFASPVFQTQHQKISRSKCCEESSCIRSRKKVEEARTMPRI